MRARLAPVAVALCLAVAGCSDDGGAAGPTLPPITEAPSASPSPAAVAVPSEASAATPEGASEFVRYWFGTLNQAAQSGDTSELRAISTPDCETCARFIESIESLYRPGGRIEGGRFAVTSVEAADVPPQAREATALVVYDVTPTRQIGAGGEIIAETGALIGETGDLQLLRVVDGWSMKAFS